MLQSGHQVGQILLDHQVISQEQLDQALAHQHEHGGQLGDALIALDLCTEVEVARALAEQNEIPFVDLEQTPPSTTALRLITREIAVEYGIIPVRIEGSRVLVAALNPYDFRLDEVVSKATEMGVLMASAPRSQVQKLLDRYEEIKYGQIAAPVQSRRAVPLPVKKRAPIAAARAVIPNTARPGAPAPAVPVELLSKSEQPAVVKKVNALVAEAYRKRARDLHFEPDEQGLRVRCRIDGEWHSMVSVPPHQKMPVLTRLKVLGGLTYADQESGGRLRVDGKDVQLRCSVLPVEGGEVLAFRFLESEPTIPALDELGMVPEMLVELRKLLAARQGLIMFVGPAACGKPTTLYSVLKHLQSQGRQVFALESTFGRKFSGLNQVQVGDRTVSSFAAGLEMALGQNAEAVLIGELPDRKTAEIACRAAASGTLILAGSHAPDSLAAINRLLDLGLQAPELGACLTGVLTQRLLRRVCDSCGRPQRVPFHLDRAVREVFTWPDGATPRKGRGCKECHQIGARGVSGVFEFLRVDEDARYMLSERVAPSVLRQYFQERLFRGLEEDAFLKVAQGLVPAEDLPRLGLRIAEVQEAFSERDEADAAPEVPTFDDWAPSIDPMDEEPEPEDWESVKNMASLLT
jgi:type II secretory ATPase GspE/PulE/Tfp pilus assembly ATPase PilB-like protein